MSDERQIHFDNAHGQRLQGVLCAGSASRACAVLCYPFADERKCAQPAYVMIARALGIPCDALVIPGADHSYCSLSAKTAVIGQTVRWLASGRAEEGCDDLLN